MEYFDSHIHYFENIDFTKLVLINSTSEQEFEILEKLETDKKKLFIAIHPHKLSDEKYENNKFYYFNFLESYAKRGFSLGETGLDTLKPNFNLQIEYFSKHIELAKRYNSILSIHSVKSLNRVLEMVKNLDSPVIFHSFILKGIDIKKMQKKNYFISLSPLSIRSKNIFTILDNIDIKKILVESDESKSFDPVKIDLTIEFISKFLKIDFSVLKNLLRENLENLFYY